MKISIIVPVYNAEKTIEYCIDSIIAQKTKFEIELILVEDYSTDRSYEICSALEKKYTEIKLYRTDGKGVSAARNTGLSHSTGDVIGFCDSDDIYEKDVFEKVRPFFEKKNIDIVIGGFYYSKKDSLNTVVQEIHSHNRKRSVEGHLLYNMVLNDERILGSVCNKFYLSESIRKFSFLTELEYCEDLVFNAELVEKNDLKAIIIGYPIYHYIINEKSATNNKDRLFTNDSRLKYIVALEKLLDEVSDRKYKVFTEYKIVTIALDFLFHNYADAKQKVSLKETVNRYKWGFLSACIVNIPFGSLKWMAKSIIVSIRGWRKNEDQG